MDFQFTKFRLNRHWQKFKLIYDGPKIDLLSRHVLSGNTIYKRHLKKVS